MRGARRRQRKREEETGAVAAKYVRLPAEAGPDWKLWVPFQENEAGLPLHIFNTHRLLKLLLSRFMVLLGDVWYKQISHKAQ